MTSALLAAGIYCSGYDTHLNARNGFPVFSTHIEANFVSKATDAWNVYKLTDEDRQRITKMGNDARIGEGQLQQGLIRQFCDGLLQSLFFS